MLKKSALAFLIICCTSCTFHMNSRNEVISQLNKIKKTNKPLKLTITEEKTLINAALLDTFSNSQANFEYHFDDKGKQLEFHFNSAGDCFDSYLNIELKRPGYRWKKVNDSTYLSKFRLRRILKIHSSNKSFDIIQHEYPRKSQKELPK